MPLASLLFSSFQWEQALCIQSPSESSWLLFPYPHPQDRATFRGSKAPRPSDPTVAKPHGCIVWFPVSFTEV